MVIFLNNRNGQTLIEALVALAVAMLVISALAVLTANSVNNAKYAENKSLANNLLNKTLNEVRVVRDQQGWTNFATYHRTGEYDQEIDTCGGNSCKCYQGITPSWEMGALYSCYLTDPPIPTVHNPFSFPSCTNPGALVTDFIDSPSGPTGNNFFCRRLELKEGPVTVPAEENITVDVSIAWTDGSGDHAINAVTNLSKHAEE